MSLVALLCCIFSSIYLCDYAFVMHCTRHPPPPPPPSHLPSFQPHGHSRQTSVMPQPSLQTSAAVVTCRDKQVINTRTCLSATDIHPSIETRSCSRRSRLTCARAAPQAATHGDQYTNLYWTRLPPGNASARIFQHLSACYPLHRQPDTSRMTEIFSDRGASNSLM